MASAASAFGRFLLAAVACAGALALPIAPARAECIDYADYLHWEGSARTWGYAVDVAVQDEFAYVAVHGAGLEVLDVSTPQPTHLGIANTPGEAWGVAVSGAHAYVADGYAGLQVVNIDDPAQPLIVGSLDTPGLAQDVAVVGTRVYLTAIAAGLLVIDVADPVHPALLGVADTPGLAYGVALAGSLAFVADYEAGLQIIDVANPQQPQIIGSVDTPDLAVGVAVSGDRAYVADYGAGIQVIDIADPEHPSIVGTVAIPPFSAAWGIALAGRHAFVAAVEFTLYAVDLLALEVVGSFDTAGLAYGVTAAGGRAYVTDHVMGLQVLNIEGPASPSLIAEWGGGDFYDLALAGTLVCAVGLYPSLTLCDISDPSHPAWAGSVQLGTAPCRGVAVANGYALVAADHEGLKIVEIVDPANAHLVGQVDTPGYAYDVAVAGDYAFVADYQAGLQVVDISDPAAPQLVGSAVTADWACGVALAGGLAFVVAAHYGFQVFDITEPAAPTSVGGIVLPGSASGVALGGGLAYVSSLDKGLHVVDLSDPRNPELLGSQAMPGEAQGVAALGSLVFVADGISGLQIVDAAEPAQPRILGSLSTDWASAVVLDGEQVYIADRSQSLLVAPMQCVVTTAGEPSAASGVTALRAFPNPTASAVRIGFALPMAGPVQVSILDVAGRRVRELASRRFAAGAQSLAWDGRDDAGREMPAGVYLVRISTPAGEAATRLVRLR